MARIFLDVGGYLGDSVYAALDPLFGFDRIYTFEPVDWLAANLGRIADSRLTVVKAGLLDSTGARKVFHAGTLAGSVFSDAPAYLEQGTEQTCQFIEASDFFRSHIGNGDTVYMKLNCEGAECAILENLAQTGQIKKITEVLVDFDALKIPSQSHRVDALRSLLAAEKVVFHTPEQVEYGMINNYGSIRNWLLVTNAAQPGIGRKLASVAYQSKVILTKQYNGYYKMLVLRRAPWLKPIVNFVRGRRGGVGQP
jgi:FkbM family methyltransferase